MKLFSVLRNRIRSRLELMRARMNMRRILDHELIGRYCGLLFIPFVMYVCIGRMNIYSDNRIRDALKTQRNVP
ncbi:unnamed protein product [Phytomonas sp. Hart1]|nr:unnamed protein product [Phytomonas sp. Hart1]|eukprot:CCW67263.1 unnamed protein product [Phytomonas sp. isolate Hart1]